MMVTVAAATVVEGVEAIKYGRVAHLEERHPYKVDVAGSSPASTTNSIQR